MAQNKSLDDFMKMRATFLILSLASALTFNATAQNEAGLVAYWPLDSANGTTPDEVGNFDLTLNEMDASNLTSGQDGQALEFNGEDEILTITHEGEDALLPIHEQGSYSVTMWVNGPSGQEDQRVFSEGSTTDSNPLLNIGTHSGGANGAVDIYTRPGAGHVVSTRMAFDETWHHIAWVDDEGDARLYIDGELDETDFSYDWVEKELNTTSVGGILRADPSHFFEGQIDDVALWNTPLTASQVQALAEGTSPPEIEPVPPEFLAQPEDVTAFAGSSVQFQIEATGTAPLDIQWFQDDEPIAGATSATLTINDVSADNEGNYYAEVSNSVSSVESEVAELTVEAVSGPQVKVDFTDREATGEDTVQEGFESFVIEGSDIQDTELTREFGDIGITLSGSGGVGYDDRNRETPANEGDFTQAQLLQDFVFSREDSGNQGLDVVIDSLEPNQTYTITIWSFDTASTGARVSDWYANGGLVKEDYTFNGADSPSSNLDSQFEFVAWADSEGEIVIEGRRDDASQTFAVFLNALRVTPGGELPAPEITSQPKDVSTLPGAETELRVAVRGSGPLEFQWFHDDEAIPEATGRALTLTDIQPQDAGSYHVEVEGPQETLVSESAELTVEGLNRTDAGLVANWPLDSANGTAPEELNDFGMTLNEMDPENVVEGRVGSAFEFNGNDEFLSFIPELEGGLPIYTHGDQSYSVTMWVRGSEGQEGARVFAEGSTTSDTPLFTLGTNDAGEGGTLDVFIRNDAVPGQRNIVPLDNVTSEQTVFDGNWHHIAWVDNNGAARLYIDGELDGTDYGYRRGRLTLDAVAIGAILRDDSSNFFEGAIDDVGLWTEPLTQEQIQSMVDGTPALEVEPSAPEIVSIPPQIEELTRATLRLEAEVSGSGPLTFQWLQDGEEIPGATDKTLVLEDVQERDAGTYQVRVSNAEGSVTSEGTEVAISSRPPTPEELSIDINERGMTDAEFTQEGFESFAIGGRDVQVGEGESEGGTEGGITTLPVTKVFDGVELTLSGTTPQIGMDDRRRGEPLDQGEFTQSELLRDFVFANVQSGDEGLQARFRFLKPNQHYRVTAWAFDTGSTGERVSDWFVNGSLVREGYSFDGANLPTSNEANRLSFTGVSDSNGELELEIRQGFDGNFGVFLNAITIEESLPPLQIADIRVTGQGDVELEIASRNPQREHRIQAKESVTEADWTKVDASFSEPEGNTLQATFPMPAKDYEFYRVINLAPPALFESDFEEGAENWTTGGQNNSWELGTPEAGPEQAYSGENVWGTTLDDVYPLSAEAWLRSPEIDLSGVETATLKFRDWHDIQPPTQGNLFHSIAVNVKSASDPNGEPLVQLMKEAGAQQEWRERSLSLGENVLGERIILEFLLQSDSFGPERGAGWYIDDVMILPE